MSEGTQARYSMSFTTGGLFYQESLKLAALFLESSDWKAVRDEVLSNNLLQARTLNTSKRVCRELISRLKTLELCELDLLVSGSFQEQGYLLWVAVCRRYTFIADFAIEVVRERHISLKYDLAYEHFDSFFNSKSAWHPELDDIRLTTRNKLRQVLFRILRETGLLTADNAINTAVLSPRLLQAMACSKPQDLRLFPMLESDLRRGAR